MVDRSYEFDDPVGTIHGALESLEEHRMRVIVAATFYLRALVQAIYERGMFGPEYLWIFLDAISAADFTSSSSDSVMALGAPLRAVVHGSLYIERKSSQSSSGYANLTRAWCDVDEDAATIKYLREHLDDKQIKDRSGSTVVNSSSFILRNVSHLFSEDALPLWDVAAYAYDAVVTAAIAACRAERALFPTRSFYPISKYYEQAQHLMNDAIKKNSSFEGVTGLVEFNSTTGDRSAGSSYGVLRNVLVLDDGTVDMRTIGQLRSETGWSVAFDSVVFADGSHTPPPYGRAFCPDGRYANEVRFPPGGRCRAGTAHPHPPFRTRRGLHCQGRLLSLVWWHRLPLGTSALLDRSGLLRFTAPFTCLACRLGETTRAA